MPNEVGPSAGSSRVPLINNHTIPVGDNFGLAVPSRIRRLRWGQAFGRSTSARSSAPCTAHPVSIGVQIDPRLDLGQNCTPIYILKIESVRLSQKAARAGGGDHRSRRPQQESEVRDVRYSAWYLMASLLVCVSTSQTQVGVEIG